MPFGEDGPDSFAHRVKLVRVRRLGDTALLDADDVPDAQEERFAHPLAQ